MDPGSSSPSPDHVPAPEPRPDARPQPPGYHPPEPPLAPLAPRSDSPPEPFRTPKPPRWGLGDFFWIYVAGIVASVLGESVGLALTGDTAGHIGALTTALATLAQFGTWFGGVVLVGRRKGTSARHDFGLTIRASDWWVLLAGIGVFLAATVLIAPLVHLANAHQQVVDDLDNASGAKLAVFAVVAVVIAPVCEELLFRGLLMQALRRKMPVDAAVIVQALVFALAHPLLSPTVGDVAVVPALFLLGAISGAVAARRGDLSASIWLHMGFNLLTTLLAL